MDQPGARRTISVIVPVYYNAGSLPSLFGELQELERALAERDLSLELIFVNDGSGDDSQAELLKIRAQRPATKIIAHARNFGAIAASKTGFRHVTGDAFIVHAADLQDPTSQILKMVDEWRAGHPYVISVRTERDDPASSMLFAWVYYRVVRALLIPTWPEGGFDLMLSDREILPYLRDSDKRINPNMLAYSLGFPPRVLEYTRRKRLHGRSRWTLRKKLHYFIDTVTAFSAAPMRIVSVIGIGVACLSFFYGLHMIGDALRGNRPVQGFITIVVLISFFCGLILLMLAMIAEYLWRIFEFISRKPESVIDPRHTYL